MLARPIRKRLHGPVGMVVRVPEIRKKTRVMKQIRTQTSVEVAKGDGNKKNGTKSGPTKAVILRVQTMIQAGARTMIGAARTRRVTPARILLVPQRTAPPTASIAAMRRALCMASV